MIKVSELVLVTRNARDKIQIAIVSLSQIAGSFVIERKTGQYLGKFTPQPDLTIEKGKAKRSVLQQAELEYNSIVKKYLDKGYKRLDSLTKKSFEDISETELNSIVPSLKTDQNGNLKHMLAKPSTDIQNSVLNKKHYCSRKLNGVRMSAKLIDNNGEKIVISVSRGGKNYNAATAHILSELKPFLLEHPDITFDGEVYIHGKHLQEISGIARLETWHQKCEELEYWVYDLAIPSVVFEDRLEILKDLKKIFKDSNKVKIMDHYETNSWIQIQKLHDQWVSEGFEGLVARKADKEYQFGKRNSAMIKVKLYQDDEFEIIDYKEGLRDEDFVFVCQTKLGKVFEAKPMGDRALKTFYLTNIDDIIGKMGTVKFFEYSKDGIPLQTVFQSVRYD